MAQSALQDLFQTMIWNGISFIMIEAAFSGAIRGLSRHRRLGGSLSDTWKGLWLGAVAGAFFPAQGGDPAAAARALRRGGSPEAPALAYALAAPTLGAVCVVTTYLAFRGSLVWVGLRVAGGLVAALAAGIAAKRSHDDFSESWDSAQASPDPPLTLRGVLQRASDRWFSAVPVFVLAVTLAVAAHAAWPTGNAFQGGPATVAAVALMTVAGGILSLSPAADAFIGAALAPLFPPGAVLAFLLAGQTVNWRNAVRLRNAFGGGLLARALAAAAGAVLLTGLLAGFVFPRGWA